LASSISRAQALTGEGGVGDQAGGFGVADQ
jgi:hypothetical protein